MKHLFISILFFLWQAVVMVCFLFYMSDLLLDAWVLRTFVVAGNIRQAWFIGFCMLIPNLYAGYKSLQWLVHLIREVSSKFYRNILQIIS